MTTPYTDAEVEAAARALAGLEPGEDWPTNAALGGSLTGTRDDEYRHAMHEQALDALDAVAGSIAARALREAGRVLQKFATERFSEHGPHDPRGAALWDAGAHLYEVRADRYDGSPGQAADRAAIAE
jgi:hypothetical protein